MVVRNEAGRYLRETVASLRQVVDGLLVFDDGSEDGSADIAIAEGAKAVLRPVGVPPWIVHEGRCREAAWRALVANFKVDLGDWVISIDADEFVVTDEPDRRQAMLTTIQEADEAGCYAITLRVHEVFGWQDDTPMVRTDGYWGNLTNTRMLRWGVSTRFPDLAMGSGSIPGQRHRALVAERFALVHLGYAREADRRAKSERYSTLEGHNPAHVRSILRKPKLRPWPGELPCGPS